MPLCVGVAFKKVAKSYWFNHNNLILTEGDRVIVQTALGEQIGRVRIGIREVQAEELTSPLSSVLRIASPHDCAREEANQSLSRHTKDMCAKLIDKHQLPIKMLSAEYSFDGKVFTLNFASNERVDFRSLVKDLKLLLKCKVVLHQVGVRDHASILGGLGQCGRPLCCSTFLTEFESVPAEIAKDQSYYQNPVRYSGMCGKLMCCLKYENSDIPGETSQTPRIGSSVVTSKGEGKVIEVDVLSRNATVELADNREQIVFALGELTLTEPHKCTKCKSCVTRNTLQN